MAGFYPDVPGPRMAYHRDGSSLVTLESGGSPVTRSAAEANQFNSEAGSATWMQAVNIVRFWHVGWVFPELRTLQAYFFNFGTVNAAQSIGELQWSADTTNLLDGTWTNIVNPFVGFVGNTSPSFRTNITSITPVSGIKGLRFRLQRVAGGSDITVNVCHLYGYPDAGVVRYLMLTDTAGTEVTGPYFDMGDDPRGGPTEDKQFKVKNGHATLTANTVTVSYSAPTDKSPSFADDYTFSSDGTTFTSTLNLGNLAPGASSGTLYVRRTTPSAAALGLETGIIVASAASWS